MAKLLPPGWRVKNSEGDFAGPPPLPESHQPEPQGDDGSEDDRDAVDDEGGLDIRPDSPGWEDMEVDTEQLSVQCLLCPQQFSSLDLMLDHSKDMHGFDFVQTVRSHNFDFYKTIKFVNLVRSQVRDAAANPTHVDPTSLDSDDLLKPILEDDSLLFSLDDIISFDTVADQEDSRAGDQAP